MNDTAHANRPRLSADDIADALGRYRHTPEQKTVIEAPLEPLLVVAGAGSGKTDTMASRVVWLVANDIVRPAQILGLTFTRKAAGELAERIGQRLRLLEASGLWTPPVDEDGTEGLGEAPTVSTYNAYAGRIVSEHGLRLGIEPDSRMLSEAASWQFAHEVVASWDGDMSDITVGEASVSAGVLGTSGELGEHQRDVTDLREYYDGLLAELDTVPFAPRKRSLGNAGNALRAKARGHLQLLPLVEGYTRLKAERTALDFSDQIAFAARLAQRFDQIGAGERSRFRAVLLDEFQDTSAAQIAFLASVFARGDTRPGVIAVGDPHQSIFGWRGASATTLATFRRSFALPNTDETPVASLSTSWRNDRAILDVANLVASPLARATRVPVEPLQPRPDAGDGTVLAARLETDLEEAAFVARWIAEQRADSGTEGTADATTGRTAAVLCRKRSQFVPMLEALEREGVPAEAVGLGGLLQTPEVVDLVSMLWVVDDPGRGDHLMRLLTGPSMRLGPADIDALGTWARELHERHRDEAVQAATGTDANPKNESHTRNAPVAREEADLAEDTRDDVSLIEAIGELPDESWRGRDDERFSPQASARLRGFHTSLERLRLLTGLPLADFVGEAERVLGLDIEVLARPGYDPSTARAHLDAFADIAGTFSAQAERPTLGGFLDWLDAAREEERGLEMPAIEVNPRAVQVLTVHAAKGLEWDIVAIPGLTEGSFPSLDGRTNAAGEEWGFTHHSVKGWLTGLASIPYDLRGDRDGLPEFAWRGAADSAELNDRYDAYRDAGREHARIEERRLAYVAVTRAREHMLLTAASWTSGSKSPRVASSFLEEVIAADLAEVLEWSPMPPTLIDGEPPTNPLDERSQEATWPLDAMADVREAMTPGARLVEGALERMAAGEYPEPQGQTGLPLEGTPEDRDLEVELLIAERERERRRDDRGVVLPSHLSASAVVALADDPVMFARRLRRPMPTEPAVAARRGTAFHAWVEQHYGAAVLVDVDELPGFSDEDPADDDALPRLKANFLASEWAERTPVELEVSVETVVGGYAIRGRIDAVFARPDGGFTVVDWKTGARPGDEALRARSLQLATYALAYARLKGLAADKVDGAFFYAATGQTYRPVMQSAQEIEELLTGVVGD